MSENAYERFRTVLTMNLCNAVQDPAVLQAVLTAVDISMADYEITPKATDIIPATGTPEVVKLYLASKAIASLSMKTLRIYRYKLINFFNEIPKSFADITPNDIRTYLGRYKFVHNASDSYLDNIRITLNSFFQWLVDNEYLQRNPCAKVDKIKYQQHRRKAMSPYDLEYIRRNTADIREKALIDFFFSTGMRVGECAAVQLTDIDWSNRSVLIRHGKGDKERLVFFNAEAEVSLKEYLGTRMDDCSGLFVSKRKPFHQIKEHALEDIIKKVSRRTGVESYPHKLRHTFATAGIHSGIPLEKLQLLLGHAKPETTMIYADLDRTDVQNAYSKAYA